MPRSLLVELKGWPGLMADYRLWSGVTPTTSIATGTALTASTEFIVTSSGLSLVAISMWKASGMTGPWQCGLWSVAPDGTGTLLTTDSISDSGAVGWQTATLATPVPLTVGQHYRAGVLFPAATGFDYTAGYWDGGPGSSDIVDGPLTGLRVSRAVSNNQGAYTVGSTLTYPNNPPGINGANFWIDPTVSDASADVSLSDHPSAVQAASPAVGLVVDRILADQPLGALAGRPAGEQVTITILRSLADTAAASDATKRFVQTTIRGVTTTIPTVGPLITAGAPS